MGATGTVKLSDGRSITVDISTMTVKEWRGFWKLTTPDTESDAVISRLTGIPAKEIPSLLNDDLRRITTEIVKLSNRPLNDPNSLSASTLQ